MRIEALIIHSGGRIWFLIDILDAAPRRMVIITEPRASRSHGLSGSADRKTGWTGNYLLGRLYHVQK